MRRRLGAAIVAVALVSGCGGGQLAGSPAPTTAAPAPTINPGALDSGTYDAKPSPPLGVAITDDAGRVLEGRRMAGYVVGPWQVDPTLTSLAGGGPALMTDFKQLGSVMYVTTMYRTSMTGFVVGFSSERSASDPNTRLRNAVLRFPDDAAAATAASGLTEGALTMLVRTDISTDPIPTEPIRPIPIPGHPELNGTLLTFKDGDQTVREVSLVSAHGPFVLVQVARAADGPEHAAALNGRALDLQVPLLDRFQPTPLPGLTALPLDPTGLVARTVPARSDSSPLVNGTYDPPGFLQLEPDPIKRGDAMTEAGVDVVSAGLATVYQARDPSAAQHLAGALADATAQQSGSQPAAAVPGLPESRCVLVDEAGGALPRTHCFAAVDRYAISADARQPVTAAQQLAAQYKMLSG